MHISHLLPLDLYSLVQFLFTAIAITFGLLHLVKNTASKYFVVDAAFDQGGSSVSDDRRKVREDMVSVSGGDGGFCAGCGNLGTKRCSKCKVIRYCSLSCQTKHWKDGHKRECEEFKFRNFKSNPVNSLGLKSSSLIHKKKVVIFPYEEFVKLFNWNKGGFPPCGLLNCGNSCFANVVLQCLSCTRPLVAYLLERGHRSECSRNDWCFLCELQTHVERAIQSLHPFSPINILSRLPHIGGNLGYGKQEDAHEFMRFAIDTMQSVCLDEFGGEKALHPSSLETTLIQYIFGGQLESQVICTECNKISNRCENMMDLTVEIQGEAVSLEDCLEQFTVKEWLDGENMYKCDGCNDYVKAWKRLTVRQAPNVLTIALKRFQSGRFGKLNKRVTFPETLDLRPFMSNSGDATDLYQLYAVVVHVDMLNASYFGHYICYTKDFSGNWYRIDDCKVTAVELEEVLGQGAYMLLYCRTLVRPHTVKPPRSSMEEDQPLMDAVIEAQESRQKSIESAVARPIIAIDTRSSGTSDLSLHAEESIPSKDPMHIDLDGLAREDPQDMDVDNAESYGCDNECHPEPGSASFEESIPKDQFDSASSSKALPSDEADELQVEVLETSSDVEGSFKVANEETSNHDEDLMSSEIAVNGYSSDLNDVHVMASTSSSHLLPGGASTGETLDEANPELQQAVTIKSGNGFITDHGPKVKASKSIGENSCSREKSKLLFSPGFLDKGFKKAKERRCSLDGDLMTSEIAVDGHSSDGNDVLEMASTSSSLQATGLASTSETIHEANPGLQQVVTVESGKGFIAVHDSQVKASTPAGENSCSREKPKLLFSPGFLDKGAKKKTVNRNDEANKRTVAVSTSSMENGYCNGSTTTKHGFLYQNGSSQVNSLDGVSVSDSPLSSSTSKEQFVNRYLNGDCNGEAREDFHVSEISFPVKPVHRVVPTSLRKKLD